ncbi:Large cysteine-rich periplasmic protein OmcB precursor [Planctomycetes bacterium Poly30]|uniref:Large cysteine-rich periplasmic protein OmcB n=1 Tax=Saltatorellus ferox TaxID=2528018 RepID=A0A518EQN1_9BACT|nr:Large cysteine-rich periplasmic protein OmcB precursor [Planctomycetes bacterium Poly30]
MTLRSSSVSTSEVFTKRPGALLIGLAILGATSCATGRYSDSSYEGSGRSLTSNDSTETGSSSSSESLDDITLGLMDADGADESTPRTLEPMVAGRKTALAFPTGDKRTSAVLLEKEMPAEVILGAPFEYRIMVENLTDRALDTVRVTDQIPASLAVSSTEPKADVAGGYATWNLGVLPARSTKTLVVRAQASSAGAVATCASVAYESSLCSTTTVVSPSLQVALSAPEVGLACDAFDLTVSVTNSGTGDARDVVVIDELPEGLTTLTGQRRIEMEFGTLAGAQTKEKSVKVKAAGQGSYTHNARAEAKGGLQASAASIQTVLRAPILTLDMSATEKVTAGRPIETVLTVANTGNAVSDKTTVQVKLPQGAKVESSTEGARATSTFVKWDVGALEPGEKRTFNLGLTSNMSGSVVTEATAAGYCADEVTATARSEVRGLPALLLEVRDESDLIIVGEPVSYVIEITNQGSAPDLNIGINCQVEDGIEIVSAGGDAQATVTGKEIQFTQIPSLAPGEMVSLRVTVKSTKELNSRFLVSLTSDDMTRPVTETESTRFVQ